MRIFSTVYILLLAYTIAALVFWGFSLQRQNHIIYEQQRIILGADVDSAGYPQLYNQRLAALDHKEAMRTKQYIGEGGTFLLIILIGAAVVFSSFRRNLRLSRQQNNFMLSVTHELKSPIAAIKLNLQTLEKRKLDEEKQQLLLQRSVKEANRLNDLCTNMLLASQIEGRQYVPTQEVFNFSDLVEDCISDYANRYPQRFEEDILPGCTLSGDSLMLQMAINNLLENAIKYTPHDKIICVKLFRRAHNIVLQVIDEGQGISDAEKKKIFNKFYRIGNEESRKSKGTGLGLYLTCKIISQHHGRITVRDNKPNGAIFEVCLLSAMA